MQAQLYEDFAHTRAKHDVDESITGEEKRNSSDQPPTHIFQVKGLEGCTHVELKK